MNPHLKRLRWRLIAISLACLTLALGSFALNQWVYSGSDDQCSWVVEGGHVVIREILPDGVAEEAGLLEGDELLKIQGRTVEPTLEGTLKAQRFINAKPEGSILIYTLRRQDRLLLTPVRLVKPLDWGQITLLANGVLAWAVGLLVVLSAPERKTSRHFFYLSALALLISGIFLEGNAPPAMGVTIQLLATAAGALLPPLWVHFFLRFPQPLPWRRNHQALRALYGTFVVFSVIRTLVRLWAQVGDGVLKAPGSVAPTGLLKGLSTFLNFLSIPLILGAALLGLGCFVVGTYRSSPRLRDALAPSLAITAILCLDLAAWTVLQGRFGESLLFRRQIWVFLLPLPLLPLGFAYAIFRHGLFDVRKTLLRWITYLAVLGGTVIAYVGGLAWAFSHLSSIPPGWAGALLGLLALPLGWVLRTLLKAIRRRFHRDLASIRELALSAVREPRKRFNEASLLKALQRALQEAFQPQLLEWLPIQDGQILLPPAEGVDREERRVALASQPLTLPLGLLRLARENGELVLGLGSDEAPWIQDQGAALRIHLDALEAQLLLLLFAGETPHSAVLLGGKYAELSYTREDRELLREVGLAAGQALEAAVMHQRLLAQERLSQELATARQIQEGLITTRLPEQQGFQAALRLEPALETGGDLLYARQRPDGTWLAAVGDVCGKGLAAALTMAQATALLEEATQRAEQDLATILEGLDQTLRRLLGPRGYVTLILLAWDAKGQYRLARAGHPGALKRSSDGRTLVELSPRGRGLGLRPAAPGDWEILEGHLAPGEWLVLYSDGLTEAMNAEGRLYGQARLEGHLGRPGASPETACEAIFSDVAGFDDRNPDDRTLFILGREP